MRTRLLISLLVMLCVVVPVFDVQAQGSPSIKERISKQFGGWDKVPQYLKEALGFREQVRQASKEKAAALKRKRAEEQAKREALWKPPAKVWRVGFTLFWTAPETVGQTRLLGYWVAESGSLHGDYVPADVFESQLYGTGPASVTAYYADMGHYNGSVSPTVYFTQGEHCCVVGAVRYYAAQGGRPPAYYERWRRVLAALGVTGGRWYDLRRGVMDSRVQPLDPPMSAKEAQGYADRWGGRWVPVAKVLARLERE